ncbi:ABC transporter substrate-binding protein [Pseudobacillus badius]|uniref:ABC transporter substrate-binding protein n=1 Tax=Bacillus badius TaxID=1455 RepID=UPI0007B05261|nr:ABC transporter substrate-binding protein [Bacillus badius]KZO00803.1 iron siderophore-binding protein [Bacillus badius]OCS88211.1 iron siderophore-binding protein [Bacillus badius]OVE53261.1 iron siderophore-binding protein [Bacillus badius]TDW05595.1 iron complex transport system substrate-binding protein [Bacillus badius]
MHTYFQKKRFSSLLAALMLMVVFALAGCGSGEKQTSKENNASNEGAASESKPYNVKNAMGTTEVKGEPKRVVILTNEGTEALLALGVKPVGAVQSWTGDPWYSHIKSDMKGVKSVGNEGEPSVETIASLKPDLIIGNKMRHEKIYEQLSAIAPTVFSETLRGDWKENFKLYAQAVNKEEEGKQVIADFDQRVQELKGLLGDKLKQKVSIVRFMPGDVRIYHKDTFSGVILDQLGFARPEGQDQPDFAEKNVTKERIPAMDGDILFYFTYDPAESKGEAPKLEEEWVEDPLFKNLNVVKNNNIHKVDDAIWNTAGGVVAANLFLDDIEKYFLTEK